MSITKYAMLRRRLRLTHKAATDIAGVDWKAVGMGAYRMCVVALAYIAVMAVLALVERLFDEREEAAREISRLRTIKANQSGHLINLLNGHPTLLWTYAGEETWLTRCQVIEMRAPERAI